MHNAYLKKGVKIIMIFAPFYSSQKRSIGLILI